jgi:hypothetical protein
MNLEGSLKLEVGNKRWNGRRQNHGQNREIENAPCWGLITS